MTPLDQDGRYAWPNVGDAADAVIVKPAARPKPLPGGHAAGPSCLRENRFTNHDKATALPEFSGVRGCCSFMGFGLLFPEVGESAMISLQGI